ncbi:MAG TPA: hypothetical protein VMZ32_12790 [Gammaproteobacteria bacterium]|nr:hypothetical protein [Gammaproteobacteria bacterium]
MQRPFMLSSVYLRLATRVLVVMVALMMILSWWMNGPIPQDRLYHEFADQRNFLGIDHAVDVLSNSVFCVAGISGIYLTRVGCRQLRRFTNLYLTFFIAVTLTAFGSAYYHYDPDNTTLVWDRLPMSVGFTSILAAIIAERINLKLGQQLFAPLVTAGICSVLYWQWQDDLRPYFLVQFGTLLTLPLLLLLYRRPGSHYLWLGIAFYVLAKVLEVYDTQVYTLTSSWVSGHTLKHLSAGVTPLLIAMKIADETRYR